MSKKLLLEAIHSSGLFRNVNSLQLFILGLNYCLHCNELKEALDSNGVPYKFIDADANGKFSDTIEELTNNENYPMVILYDGRNAEVITDNFENLF